MFQRFFVSIRAAVLLSGAVAVFAASATQAAPHRLMDSIDGEQPIRLQSLDISTEISGSMAETTVQMVFLNPNNRPLEGNLQFPLLAGQQVTAFSLDINGKLRPAVPVEKAKGRQVFEEIERRRVDPALLEITQGNNFKLRVFPVPAGGTRTVQLKYVEGLARQGQDWAYQLPLAYDETLQNFALSIKVNGGAAAPQVMPSSGSLRDLKFERSADGYRANAVKAGFVPSGTLGLLLPANQQAQTYIQERKGQTYFVAEVPVSAIRTARVLPKVVGLLWDSSGSGTKRALDAELNELDIYFKALGNGEVRLTRLRDRAEVTEVFKIKSGNWSALRKALQATVYDGASALGDWKPEPAVGEYLLFSDGLINYGAGKFPVLPKGQRLYALNSAAAADTGRLAALAERSGGRLIQVNAQSAGAAAQELLTEGVHLDDMKASGATDLQVESADAQQGMLRIAGKLPNGSAQLRLTVSENRKRKELKIAVAANAPNHPLAAHFWAGYRLHALEADHDLQRAEIRRLGQEFGIPTSETSLIVLESVEDYVRYDIAPPAEYQTEFDQLRNARGMQVKQERKSHLDNVVRQFEEKFAWWKRTFQKDDPSKSALVAKEVRAPVGTVTTTGLRALSEPVAAPAPVLAPGEAAAPVAPRVAVAEPVQEVRVTGIRASLQQSLSVRRSAADAEVAGAQDVGRMPNKNVADSPSSNTGIALKKWTSDAPYITRMKAATRETIYAIYLDEKPSYTNSSAFFLDAADLLLEKGQRDLALRVLSNLAEMDLENRHVLRILGYRLMEMNLPGSAIPVFEKVQRLAEEEPQSFRDLGLAYAAARQYQQAIDQLNEVAMRTWDGRFHDVEIISLAELNAILASNNATSQALDTSRVDPRLLKNMPLALRVVMTWDADNSDMDLWVTDPNGEKCYYNHAMTRQGGRMSRDVTQGYGPEEFSLRDAKPGKYKVEANFYGNRQQTVAGATTLQVKLTTGFGTPKSRDQMITLRLKERGETVFVGEFEVKP